MTPLRPPQWKPTQYKTTADAAITGLILLVVIVATVGAIGLATTGLSGSAVGVLYAGTRIEG